MECKFTWLQVDAQSRERPCDDAHNLLQYLSPLVSVALLNEWCILESTRL